MMRLGGLLESINVGNTIKYKLSDNELLHEILEVVEKYSGLEAKERER